MKIAEIKKLVEIAQKNHLIPENRKNFEQQHSDSLDFSDCAVWSIEAALIEAYELGKAAGAKVKRVRMLLFKVFTVLRD